MSCEYCDENMSLTPSFTDLTATRGAEPELYVQACVSVSTGHRWYDLALYDEVSGEDMAAYEIRYCPMCGRKLGGDE
jgi:hypothetical protein|nr:MAG TPA: tax1-binding protein [Caudoviricetes sp.]